MKEKPILFSAPMIRALLDDKKSQTRRLLKPQPENTGAIFGQNLWNWSGTKNTVTKNTVLMANTACVAELWLPYCPYGQIGDRLWVREAFAPCCVRGTGVQCDIKEAQYAVLRADLSQKYRDPEEWFSGPINPLPGSSDGIKWRPSIHMPRWASRLTLEITEVRVERLNDISEADAICEGIERINSVGPFRAFGWKDYLGGAGFFNARASFASLFDSINGAGTFEKNPWVWAISFRRLEVESAI